MRLAPRSATGTGELLAAPLEAADRLIVALVEGDVPAVERELALEVCAWWRDGGSLAALHGPVAVATALVRLLEVARPEQLSARATSEGSVVVSALAEDHLVWALELRASEGHFVGCVVRGARQPSVAQAS